MEAAHRDILRRNRCDLVQAIQCVEEVVDKLVQFEVLTIFMKAEIIEKPRTSFDRVRELLDMLPRRGPQAYSLFCKALMECRETQAMALLGLETDKQMTELQNPRCHLHLGDNVFVTAKTWDGVLNIHVRKYEVYPSGKAYPTKRGIVLTLKHWLEIPSVFIQLMEAVREGRNQAYVHIGVNVYASLDPNGSVDLRQWEKNDQLGVVPTAKGIMLSPDQWKKLRDCYDVMPDFVPELKDMVPCMAQEDHQNQMGYLQCSFCNPNDYECWSN
ncbi:uncharacterized protein LOC124281642 [Haliotis rubra]|uniref:uncharacterized protein LOC124281642 n=1 Tax=Haliotis rubra TaxID=36100 RepID=UPI001EE55EF0|nr:uncharacterized protein LOC124281642 [Haliotis rubra]